MALHREAERICRELGNKHVLSASLVRRSMRSLGAVKLEKPLAMQPPASFTPTNSP